MASISDAIGKSAYSGAEVLGRKEDADCSCMYGGGGIGVSDQVVDGMLVRCPAGGAGAAGNSRIEMDGLMFGGSRRPCNVHVS